MVNGASLAEADGMIQPPSAREKTRQEKAGSQKARNDRKKDSELNQPREGTAEVIAYAQTRLDGGERPAKF